MGVEAMVEIFHDQPQIVEQLPQFYIDKKAMDENERFVNDKGKDSPVMSTYSLRNYIRGLVKLKRLTREVQRR